ncbi:MAG TPA: hypothetical protein ENN73_00055 [Firmicutes bacterium]|nr:hypothetical protein [Bacillota bacterium]
MKRNLTLILGIFLIIFFAGCTPLEENVISKTEEKDILEYSHTWKSGATYQEFSNSSIKGTLLFFSYDISPENKDKFAAATVNNIFEVSAILSDAQKKYEHRGIKFLFIDSIKNPDLLKQFKVKTPPVVVILDFTGTQVHRFNPAAKSMISSSFTSEVSLSSKPSEQQEAFDSGMINTVNRTMAAELDNVLEYLVTH